MTWTLQNTIDDLKAKAAEYKAKAVDPRETEEWRARSICMGDALLERAEEYTLILAAEAKEEAKDAEKQSAEMRLAQHRARVPD
jgi:hypothetical protein